MGLAVGTIDETASRNGFFLVDGLHLRDGPQPVKLDIDIL
jgi:hypothetical protein